MGWSVVLYTVRKLSLVEQARCMFPGRDHDTNGHFCLFLKSIIKVLTQSVAESQATEMRSHRPISILVVDYNDLNLTCSWLPVHVRRFGSSKCPR